MNKKFVIHPGDYAIGENEKLYSDMATKGWILKKRHSFFSSFEKKEPQKLIYRIDISSPAILDDDIALPQDQIDFYDECGWKFITRSGLVNVFCAPETTAIPELYSDPRQQAETLKALKSNNIIAWIPVAVILVLDFLLAMAFTGTAGETASQLLAQAKLSFISKTAEDISFLFLMLWGLESTVHSAICTSLLYRRLKKGQALNHSPKRKHRLHTFLNAALAAGIIIFLGLSVFQWTQYKAYPMPDVDDYEYLLLSRLGYDGERTASYNGDKSEVCEKHTLATDILDTKEFKDGVFLYQTIYHLKTPSLVNLTVDGIIGNGVLAKASDFHEVEIYGLDRAYTTGMESIAVSGNTVYYFISIVVDEHFPNTLTALSEKLSNEK